MTKYLLLEKIKEYILDLELKKELNIEMEEKKELQNTEIKDKIYLNVPLKEKKSWYAPIGSDLNNFQNWEIKKENDFSLPKLSPKEEFKEALLEMGLIVSNPIMDGTIQRVAVLGAENGKDGAYQAYSDGKPNGWIQNHKTGEISKWLSTGQVLSPKEKEALQARSFNKTKRACGKKKCSSSYSYKKSSVYIS